MPRSPMGKRSNASLVALAVGTLGDLLVPIPPKDVLAAFNHQAIQALDLIHNNLNESVNLRKLRDWLLPMLMNGQATVSD